MKIIFKSLLVALTSISAIAQSPSPAGGIVINDGQKVAFLGDSITSCGFENPAGYVNLVISGLNTCGLKVTPHHEY